MPGDWEEGLENLKKELETAQGKAFRKIVLNVEKDAKRFLTIKIYTSGKNRRGYKLTGRLRRSVTHAFKKRMDSLIGMVGSNVEYAPYIEFGTKYFVGKPYLRPALEKNKREAEEYYRKYIQNIDVKRD